MIKPNQNNSDIRLKKIKNLAKKEKAFTIKPLPKTTQKVVTKSAGKVLTKKVIKANPKAPNPAVMEYKNTPSYTKKETLNKNIGKQEQQQDIISSKLGDYFIQDHLRAVSAHTYTEEFGAILAKSQGYYFVSSEKIKKPLGFPLVVQKKGKASLRLLTGVISIKSNSPDKVFSIASQYSLQKVQFFEHLDLYIYQLSSTQNLITTYETIKNSSGIEQATLEILNKRVQKL